MRIEIDPNSGFCFGVVYAVKKADEYLQENDSLYCLGDIVHNDEEVKRLEEKGLKIIDFDTFGKLKNSTVLLRAHGEPPETYEIARKNNIKLIDASCPIVLRLQMQIYNYYNKLKDKNGQIVIFGKPNHAEVIALNGHAENKAIIISSIDEIDKIDFDRPVALFSQTTKNSLQYREIIKEIEKRMKNDFFFYQESVCKQVANRHQYLYDFCKDKDLVIFISGKKSSNGQMLYQVCKNANKNCKFVSELDEIDPEWLKNAEYIGISGATSTPSWLIDQAKNMIENIAKEKYDKKIS